MIHPQDAAGGVASRNVAVLKLKRALPSSNSDRIAVPSQTNVVLEKLDSVLDICRQVPFLKDVDFEAYLELTRILLGPVLHEWYPLFDDLSRRERFDVFFCSHADGGVASPGLCVLALCVCTKFLEQEEKGKLDPLYMGRYLGRTLEQRWLTNEASLRSALSDFERRSDVLQQQFLKNLCSVRDRLCSALRRETPDTFSQGTYFALLSHASIGSMMGCLCRAPRRERAEIKDAERFYAATVHKLVANGGAAQLSYVFVKDVISHHSKSTDLGADMKSLQDLIRALPTVTREKFIVSIVMDHISLFWGSSRKRPMFYRLFRPLVHRSVDMMYIFQKVILMKKLPPKEAIKFSLRLICNPLEYGTPGAKSRFAMPVLTHLVEFWGSPAFVNQTDYARHANITRQVLYGLRWTSKDDIERTALLRLFLSGVQTHMESSVEKVRKLGMMVARRFSLVLEPSKPIQFEGILSPEEISVVDDSTFGVEDKDDEDYASDDEDAPGPAPGGWEEEGANNNGAQVLNRDHPDAPVHTDDELSSDTESEDSDDMSSEAEDETAYVDTHLPLPPKPLTPYDLPDETRGPGYKLPEGESAPLYLGEFMKGLQEREKYDVHYAALLNLEKAVRRNDPSLMLHAVELTSVLIHLTNRFAVDNFVEVRDSCLVALLANCPERVSAYLTRAFFEEEHSLTSRHNMLSILVKGAHELATKKKELGQAPEDRPQILDVRRLADGTTVTMKPSQDPTLGTVVKRFRPTQRAAEGTVSEFNKFAGTFFFPLAARYDRSGRTFDLVGRDFPLLSALITSLGTFVELARNALVAPQMGAAMLELVMALWKHKDARVRRSLLFALSRVLLNVRMDLLLQWFVGDLEDISRWVFTMSKADTDAECRRLSAALVQSKMLPATN